MNWWEGDPELEMKCLAIGCKQRRNIHGLVIK